MRKVLPITVIFLLLALSMTPLATAQKQNIIVNETTETLYVISSTKFGAQGDIPAGYRTSGWKTIAAGEQRAFWAYDPHKIYFQIWKGSEPIKPQRSTETFAFWIDRNANFDIVTRQEINGSITRAQLLYSSHGTDPLTHRDGFMKYNNGSQITVTNAWVDVEASVGEDPPEEPMVEEPMVEDPPEEPMVGPDLREVPVNIPDSNLRAAIEKALGKAEGATITQADMQTLTEFEASKQSIQDLTGLEFATNLTGLALSDNQISDLSPLAELKNLTKLFLINNQISDISPLAGLQNLIWLYLSNNKISDISSLSNLKNLIALALSDNQISDFSPITELIPNLTEYYNNSNQHFEAEPVNIPDPNLRTAIGEAVGKTQDATITRADMLVLASLDISETATENLTGLEFGINLRQLNLSRNWIEDISPLAGLRNLTSLDLSGNAIEDISPLAGLTNLTELVLSDNPLSDISPLAGLGNLTSLTLFHNWIEDISPLANLTSLTSLNLENVPIEDVSLLAGLTSLTSLNLVGVPIPIEDISPLVNLTNLTSLSLSFNQIEDISSLAGLTNLTSLDLSQNTISDISPLAGLTNLTSLNLSLNQIEDISPLVSLTTLTTLNLYGNYQIEDISPLAGLTNLTSLDLSENFISDVSPLAGLINLRALYLIYNLISDFSPIADLIPNLETYHSGNQRLSAVAVNPEALVDIPDPVLRTAIENELGKSPGTRITQAEMATLTSISFESSEVSIQDLTGLEFAVNLTKLHIKGNQISDVSALAGLKNLTWLDLSSNLILDVSALAGLNNLIWLDLSSNPYTYRIGSEGLNVVPIAQLQNLRHLALAGNRISDVVPIAQLKNVSSLDLSRNAISDISPLAALRGLETLGLSDNTISDVSVLADLRNLTWLDLGQNVISDISPLSDLTNLIVLSLSSNVISDISALIRLEYLTSLRLSDNRISDFSPIADLIPHLETYENDNQTPLTNNQAPPVVVDPAAPVHIPDVNLRTAISMALGKSAGARITQAEMATLLRLLADSRLIQDLTGLAFAINLRTLELSNNAISDVSPLAGLVNLERLYLSYNHISDFSPIRSLIPNLAEYEHDNQTVGDPEAVMADGAVADNQDLVFHGFIGHQGQIEGVEFSPDGQILASIGLDGTLAYSDPHVLQIMPASEVVVGGWEIGIKKAHLLKGSRHRSIAERQDGSMAAVGTSDRTIKLWPYKFTRTDIDLLLAAERMGLQADPLLPPTFILEEAGQVWALAFSPDGQTLASGGGFEGIHLWDTRANPPKIKNTLIANTAQVEGLAFSPDGQLLAVATGLGSGEAVHLWDIQTQAIKQILTVKDTTVRKVAFSPDGQMLAGGAYTVESALGSTPWGAGPGVLLWKREAISAERLKSLQPHSMELSGPTTVSGLGTTQEFTVTVKNANGQGIGNVEVNLSTQNDSNDANNYSGTVWTNADGKAAFKIRFWSIGTFDIDLTVLERVTGHKLEQTFSDRVEVPKPHAIVADSQEFTSFEEGEDYTDAFTLKSAKGQVLEGFWVNINTANKSDWAVTNSSGRVRFRMPIWSKGVYDVDVAVAISVGGEQLLKKTFPRRFTVTAPPPEAPHDPEPPLSSSVYSKAQRTVVRSDGHVSVIQLPAAPIGQTSSVRPSLRWTPGDTVAADLGTTVITVKFLNGSAEEQQEVIEALKHWSNAANIDFKFYSSRFDFELARFGPADIRVKFYYTGSENSSKVGTYYAMETAQNLLGDIRGFFASVANTLTAIANKIIPDELSWLEEWVSGPYHSISGVLRWVERPMVNVVTLHEKSPGPAQPTLKLTRGKRTDKQWKGTILHEFGHALGFSHTHLNPTFPFALDRGKIYEHTKDWEGWDKDDVDHNYFDKVDMPSTRKVDPDSIMTYYLKPEWLTAPDGASQKLKKIAEETGIKGNDELSTCDKEALANVYGDPIEIIPVTGSIGIYGKDDELERSDEIIDNTDKPAPIQLYIGSQEEYTSTLVKEFRWGGELRVEVHIASRRVKADSIEMKARVVLFEGAHRYTTDFEDEDVLTFPLLLDGTEFVHTFHVENLVFERKGGFLGFLAEIVNEVVASDEAKVTLTLKKGEGDLVVFTEAELLAPSAIHASVDINGDGRVDAADLVLVSNYIGQTAPANLNVDVNGDGIVTIADLVHVARYLGQSAFGSAPSQIVVPAGVTYEMVEGWLHQARLEDDGSLVFQQGIAKLEYLLTLIIPEKTALLANYPNPFNPETWIPYHLAKPADVTLTIYAVNGQVVRHLDLGHQDAGYYQSKARAAYWDGRNSVGERIASGIYFYTLAAGDFAATRKMLIMK